MPEGWNTASADEPASAGPALASTGFSSVTNVLGAKDPTLVGVLATKTFLKIFSLSVTFATLCALAMAAR